MKLIVLLSPEHFPIEIQRAICSHSEKTEGVSFSATLRTSQQKDTFVILKHESARQEGYSMRLCPSNQYFIIHCIHHTTMLKKKFLKRQRSFDPYLGADLRCESPLTFWIGEQITSCSVKLESVAAVRFMGSDSALETSRIHISC